MINHPAVRPETGHPAAPTWEGAGHRAQARSIPVRRRAAQGFHQPRRRKDLVRGDRGAVAHAPKVKLAALVAMPDPVFGEKGCAFVVPHPGETLSFPELIAFLRAQQIAAFKLPERLEIAAELPLSPVGKILKRELREIIAAKLAPDRPR